MNRRAFLRSLAGTALAALARPICAKQPKRPNILIILADDMGYSDLGCMGGEAHTPNIDALRQNGILLPNAYNNAKCAPTRATLMTGLYNQRLDAHRSAGNIVEGPGVCLAELFKAAGYNTIIAGKWHIRPDPLDCGFERHYGSLMSPAYFPPIYKASEYDLQQDGRGIDIPDDFYSTTAYTDFAIKALAEQTARADRPFFLFMSYHAPHWPLQAPPADIARYKDRYRAGTDAMRQSRYDRLIKLGVVDPDIWPLPDLEPDVPKWTDLTADQQQTMAAKLAVHAAMVDRLDREVGRLIDTLKESGQFDNTFIFIFSDNGASPEHGTLGRTDSLSRPGQPPRLDEFGSVHTYLSPGTLGAAALNAPLRKYKTTLYEGGCCTPLIVHWPNHIAKPGAISRHVCHVLDIVPTALAAASIPYPDRFRDRPLHKLEGQNLIPALQGRPLEPRTLYWHYKQARVIRHGNFKLIGKVATGQRKGGPWELYDLSTDRSETTNLADKHPDRVAQLAALWDQWNADTRAVEGYEAYTQRKT